MMLLGIEYFERLFARLLGRFLLTTYIFLLNSLEGIVTGGISCDALAEVTKASSRWLMQ